MMSASRVVLALWVAASWQEVTSMRDTEADRARGAALDPDLEPLGDEQGASNGVPLDSDEDLLEDEAEKRIAEDMDEMDGMNKVEATTAEPVTTAEASTTPTTALTTQGIPVETTVTEPEPEFSAKKKKPAESHFDLFGNRAEIVYQPTTFFKDLETPSEFNLFGPAPSKPRAVSTPSSQGTDTVTQDAIRHLEDDDVTDVTPPVDVVSDVTETQTNEDLYKDAATKAATAQDKAKEAQREALKEAAESQKLEAIEKELEENETHALQAIQPLRDLEAKEAKKLADAQADEQRAIQEAQEAQRLEQEALNKLQSESSNLATSDLPEVENGGLSS